MPLTAEDTTRLYSDAFARNAKQMLGEQSFAYADLKTQHDVAIMQMNVMADELKAAQDEVAALKLERDEFKAKWEGSTEGMDAALQASADETASRSA